MKKNAFTLIEILGVIILLGIIALIAVPNIKKSLTNSKIKLYDEQISQIKNGLKDWGHANIFLLPEFGDTITLSLGQLKQSGFASYEIKNPKNNKCFSNESLLTITKKNNSYIYDIKSLLDVDCGLIKNVPTIQINGDVVQYIKVGESFVDAGVTAKDSTGKDISSFITKTITGTGSSINTNSSGYYTITYSIEDQGKTMTAIRNVYVFKEIMTSSNKCIKSGTCPNGTKVNVKVNDSINYDFYVIKDDGNRLTLIMDRNLGEKVAWLSQSDYIAAGGTNWDDGNNEKGPLTALKALEQRTSGWTNIDSYTYTLDSSGNMYNSIIRTNVRARMLTAKESTSLKCIDEPESCPKYLYTNTSGHGDNSNSGYWLSSSHPSNPYYGISLTNLGYTDKAMISDTSTYGVRPVIILDKK